MSGITTCPRCHGDLSPHVTERGLVCPHCNNPLAKAGLGGLAAPDVDSDVRRGVSAATITLALLIAANVAGIGAAYFALGRQEIGISFCFLFLFASLDLLVVAAVMRPVAQWWLMRRPIATAGQFVGLVLLGGVVTVAVVIVFFIACVGLIRLAER